MLNNVKPETDKYKEIRRIPHTHELITFNTEKKAFDSFNDNVDIFEEFDPEKRDWQTLSLGHYKCGEMRPLKECLKHKQISKENE